MPDINPDLQVQVDYIGQEKNPLLIIDNFHLAPELLRNQAETEPPFVAQASDFYPGLRKPVGGTYALDCLAAITPIVKKTFAIPDKRQPLPNLCAFSLTTTPPEQLRPIQSVPHIDTHDPEQFAVVHYLCAETYGGTSFYRHRSTGFESISQARMQAYFKTLKHEVMEEGKREFSYIDGDTRLFERIAQVPLKFNRAIIYRSNQLHSGDIHPAQGLSANPRAGRLTVNSFFRFG
jgi:hypothetical protein